MYAIFKIAMKRTQLFIRLEPQLKARVRKFAKAERRDMNSFVVVLLENKFKETKNAK